MISLHTIIQLMMTGSITNNCPRQNLPQAWGGRKYVCLNIVWTTYNFKSNPSTSLGVNEHWSNKRKIHRLKINKIILVRWTWRRFISRETINWRQQAVTPNRNPFQNLPQACRGSRSVCLIFICPKHNCNHTLEQILVSINVGSITASKKVNNQQLSYWN